MSAPSGRGWAVFTLAGIAVWIGATVLVVVLNDDPSDGTPVLLTFCGGAAAFFGAVFAYALWRTRPRADPELDRLLAELAIEPVTGASGAAAVAPMRRVARAYILLGALVTALGLLAILQEGLGFGSARATVVEIVVIAVLWALAIPWVLRRARDASVAVLAPLGLEQHGAEITGERHGRRVQIRFTGRESVTTVDSSGDAIELRRPADEPAGWLRDLEAAERRADEREAGG